MYNQYVRDGDEEWLSEDQAAVLAALAVLALSFVASVVLPLSRFAIDKKLAGFLLRMGRR